MRESGHVQAAANAIREVLGMDAIDPAVVDGYKSGELRIAARLKARTTELQRHLEQASNNRSHNFSRMASSPLADSGQLHLPAKHAPLRKRWREAAGTKSVAATAEGTAASDGQITVNTGNNAAGDVGSDGSGWLEQLDEAEAAKVLNVLEDLQSVMDPTEQAGSSAARTLWHGYALEAAALPRPGAKGKPVSKAPGSGDYGADVLPGAAQRGAMGAVGAERKARRSSSSAGLLSRAHVREKADSQDRGQEQSGVQARASVEGFERWQGSKSGDEMDLDDDGEKDDSCDADFVEWVQAAVLKAGTGGVRAWASQFADHFTFNLNVLPKEALKPQSPVNPYDAPDYVAKNIKQIEDDAAYFDKHGKMPPPQLVHGFGLDLIDRPGGMR